MRRDAEEVPLDENKIRSVQLLSLFKPKQIELRINKPHHRFLKTDLGIIPCRERMMIRNDAARGELMIDSVSNQPTKRIEIVNHSGTPTFSEFTLTVPGKITRNYVGMCSVIATDSTVLPIVALPIQKIVSTVVASESSPTDPMEYLEAFAIVVRSFLVAESHRHLFSDYCDNTHCQLFFGEDADQMNAEHAATAVRGKIIEYGNEVVTGFYSAACGGATTSAQSVWPQGAAHYSYPTVACSSCSTSKYYRWQSNIRDADVSRAFGFEENIQAITIDTNSNSHQARITLGLHARSVSVTPDVFRLTLGRAFGWNRVMSNSFRVQKRGSVFHFQGHGFGHGVGFCQEGAKNLARDHAFSDDIVAHYFPQTNIVSRSLSNGTDTIKRMIRY